MKKFFGFFKLPLQIAFGAYLATMLFIGTALIMDHLDYEEDFKWCGDLQMEIVLEPGSGSQEI